MPIAKGYYTSPEALQLIKDALPNEDPEEYLLLALRNDQVWWWLLDESGNRWDLPIPTPNVEGLHQNLQVGEAFFKLTGKHSAKIQMADMLRNREESSADTNRSLGGTFQICKIGLDNLLSKSNSVQG